MREEVCEGRDNDCRMCVCDSVCACVFAEGLELEAGVGGRCSRDGSGAVRGAEAVKSELPRC